MRRFGRLMIAVALAATLGLVSACQRTVEVQTGTRIVDAQGRVVSEDIKTLQVPPETAGAYRINTITQEDAENPELAGLYADAQMAIAAGDLKTAEAKLAEVLAISPAYRNAKKQSDAIKNGDKITPDTAPSKPSTSTATPTTTTPKPSGNPETSLNRWIPDTLTGFTATKAGMDSLSVSRQYTPGAGNPAQSLVIAAEQYRTSTAAKRALSAIRQRYADNASSSKINGHTVYFGTSGGFAAAGFTSGAVVVAIEAQPDKDSVTAMKSVLESVVRQLP